MVARKNRAKQKESGREPQSIDPPRKDSSWLSPPIIVTVVLALISAAFFVGSWYMKSELQVILAKIDVRLLGVEDRLSKMENRFSNLERLSYPIKAAALGFKNPKITTISLFAPIKTPPIMFESTEKATHTSLRIQFRAVKEQNLVFLINGRVGNMEFTDAHITMPFKTGEPFDLRRLIAGVGLPPIFIVVLDMPNKDTAVIAIGPRESAST